MIPQFPDTAFWHAYQGSFSGLMIWSDVEQFFTDLTDNPDNWYVFRLDGPLPKAPLEAVEFINHLQEMRDLTLTYRDASHCFSLFSDNISNPQFVKVFDPGNLGASCGSSGRRIYPRWTLSRIKPDALTPMEKETPKQGFLGRLVNHLTLI